VRETERQRERYKETATEKETCRELSVMYDIDWLENLRRAAATARRRNVGNEDDGVERGARLDGEEFAKVLSLGVLHAVVV